MCPRRGYWNDVPRRSAGHGGASSESCLSSEHAHPLDRGGAACLLASSPVHLAACCTILIQELPERGSYALPIRPSIDHACHNDTSEVAGRGIASNHEQIGIPQKPANHKIAGDEVTRPLRGKIPCRRNGCGWVEDIKPPLPVSDIVKELGPARQPPESPQVLW